MTGSKDLTKDWVEDTSRKLHIDLDVSSIGGVKVGQSFNELSWLGPADNHEGNYEYYMKGLTVGEKDGEFFMLAMEFHQENGFEPFQGTCSAKGKQINLSPETTPEALMEQLGEPAYREVDDNGTYELITLGYNLGTEYAFNFHSDADGKHQLYAVFG